MCLLVLLYAENASAQELSCQDIVGHAMAGMADGQIVAKMKENSVLAGVSECLAEKGFSPTVVKAARDAYLRANPTQPEKADESSPSDTSHSGQSSKKQVSPHRSFSNLEDKIGVLELEYSLERSVLAEKVTQLKATGHNFKARSDFESDKGYLERLAAGQRQLEALREQTLGDIERRLNQARNKTFVSSDVCVDLDPKDYQPNEKIWPIKVSICSIKGTQKDLDLPITGAQAESLFKNWVTVSKRAILMRKPKSKGVELVELQLYNPVAKTVHAAVFPLYVTYKAMHSRDWIHQVPKSSGRGYGDRPAFSQVRFSQDGRYLFARIGSELSVMDLATQQLAIIDDTVFDGPVVDTLGTGEVLVGYVTIQKSENQQVNNSHRCKNRAVVKVETYDASLDAKNLRQKKTVFEKSFAVSERTPCDRFNKRHGYFYQADLHFSAGSTALRSSLFNGEQKSFEILTGNPLSSAADEAVKWTRNSYSSSADKRISLRKKKRRYDWSYSRDQTQLMTSNGELIDFICSRDAPPTKFTWVKDLNGNVSCVDHRDTGRDSSMVTSRELSPTGNHFAVVRNTDLYVWRTLSHTNNNSTLSLPSAMRGIVKFESWKLPFEGGSPQEASPLAEDFWERKSGRIQNCYQSELVEKSKQRGGEIIVRFIQYRRNDRYVSVEKTTMKNRSLEKCISAAVKDHEIQTDAEVHLEYRFTFTPP